MSFLNKFYRKKEIDIDELTKPDYSADFLVNNKIKTVYSFIATTNTLLNLSSKNHRFCLPESPPEFGV